MALNTTGQISLAGTTTGQSIELELGGNGTTQISLNDSTVRALAGVPTGQIVMPTNFYGKASGPTVGIYAHGWTGTSNTSRSNLVTRINACGALIGSQTNVGCASGRKGGAKTGAYATFYAGFASTYQNIVMRLNTCGALNGSQTNVGTARYVATGTSVSSCTIGMFYTGANASVCGCLGGGSRIVTRINASGTIVGSETNIGTWRSNPAGATIGSNGVYVGGTYTCCGNGRQTNTITRINPCGALVGSETAYSVTLVASGGASVGGSGVYYSGLRNNVLSNLAFKLNACGTQVGSTVAIGTARSGFGSARIGANGVFWGGGPTSTPTNTTTRISSCLASVGSETAVGTARSLSGGAGI